jgi:hypothetical protein
MKESEPVFDPRYTDEQPTSAPTQPTPDAEQHEDLGPDPQAYQRGKPYRVVIRAGIIHAQD